MPNDLASEIDEDVIVDKLVQLIGLCEEHGLDFDILMNSAWGKYTDQPDVAESG